MHNLTPKLLVAIKHVICALLLVTVTTLLLNILGDRNLYGDFVSRNITQIVATISIIVIIYWKNIAPTLRTLFGYQNRDNGLDRLVITVLASALLLLFAAYGEGSMFSAAHLHQARYGYVADFVLLLGSLGLLARFFAPRSPRLDAARYVSDEPKSNKRKLTLTQEEARDVLADILSSGQPRSIALTGDWGSGKTLVYSRARDVVEHKDMNIVWVEFDPWRYASEEALVKGFYESLARTIEAQVAGYQNALREVMFGVNQFISKSDSSGIVQGITSKIDTITSKSAEPDKIIEGLLAREGKRMVVVMDDIERQYERERTYRALQLVHHAKAISSRLQVISIFEKETLLRAAPLHVKSREAYLEKFSEIEINIPNAEVSWLRSQLEELMNSPDYESYLPEDVELDISPATMKDVGSHRGVIRAFNELLLDYHKTRNRPGGLDQRPVKNMPVNDADRFAMGHIKLKYPLIYDDIARNRHLYTQAKEEEQTLREMFMQDDEVKAERKRHFDQLFGNADLDNEASDRVKDFLVDIFPVLNSVFNDNQRHLDLDELRENCRIGHRYVLDAYFASVQSQEAFIKSREMVNKLIEQIPKVNDTQMMELFREFMQESRNDKSEMDNETLLRNELKTSKHAAYNARGFRAWLRVLTSDSFDGDEANRIIGRILSALNDLYLTAKPEDRIAFAEQIFDDIERYAKNPQTILLILLFLIPERGNGYFNQYVQREIQNPDGLFERLLKCVDDYFLQGDHNVFTEFKYEEYSFIVYQWALSIDAGTRVGINKDVSDSQERFKHVNEYVFKLLNDDDKLAFNVLKQRFWKKENDTNTNEKPELRLDRDSLAPYDLQQLVSLVDKLTKSESLSRTRRRYMRLLLEQLESYISETTTEENDPQITEL